MLIAVTIQGQSRTSMHLIQFSAGPSFQSETCGCVESHLQGKTERNISTKTTTLEKSRVMQIKLTSAGNGGFDKRVQLLVTTDGQL